MENKEKFLFDSDKPTGGEGLKSKEEMAEEFVRKSATTYLKIGEEEGLTDSQLIGRIVSDVVEAALRRQMQQNDPKDSE